MVSKRSGRLREGVETYVVFALRRNRVDELVFSHVVFSSLLIFRCVLQEGCARLLR